MAPRCQSLPRSINENVRTMKRGSNGAGTTANSYRSRTVSFPGGSSVPGGGSAGRSVGQSCSVPSSFTGKLS